MSPSPRPRREQRRRPLQVAAVMAGVALAVLLAAVPAAAHVSIKPDVAKKGSFSVFSFSVPNESDTASTVKIEVTFPTDHPKVLRAKNGALPGGLGTVVDLLVEGARHGWGDERLRSVMGRLVPELRLSETEIEAEVEVVRA